MTPSHTRREPVARVMRESAAGAASRCVEILGRAWSSRRSSLCCSASRTTRRKLRASRIVAKVLTCSMPVSSYVSTTYSSPSRRIPRRRVRRVRPAALPSAARASPTPASSAACCAPDLVTVRRRSPRSLVERFGSVLHGVEQRELPLDGLGRVRGALARAAHRPVCRQPPLECAAVDPEPRTGGARERPCGSRERRGEMRDRRSLARLGPRQTGPGCPCELLDAEPLAAQLPSSGSARLRRPEGHGAPRTPARARARGAGRAVRASEIPLSRYSPRSLALRSATSSRVRAERSTWPPCPAAQIRAARWTSRPR